MLGNREALAEKTFTPGLISKVAEALSESGRNVEIVERSWGTMFFGGRNYVLVEVQGKAPWKRKDLMESSVVPNCFFYRAGDLQVMEAVLRLKNDFPNSKVTEYQPKDPTFRKWALNYLRI